MSKISLTPNASGTGTFTIASPDSNTNRTLTLPDADGALLAGAQAAFIPATVSGATQALDVGAANFFDAGTLTADTTVSFTNVPTEARWTYTLEGAVSSGTDWDVSTASFVQFFSVQTEETSPQDVFFKTDGTKMYILGGSGVDITEYDLDPAWDVTSAIYSSVFSVNDQESGCTGFFFKSDGTKFYVIGDGNDRVFQYTMSTAWDISTSSYDSVNGYVGDQDLIPLDVFFSPDGTKMYMSGALGNDVNEYSLSTAWNVSTISFVRTFDTSANAGSPQGIFFKPDGTKMFVAASTGDKVSEFSLSTAWNISTLSYVQNLSIGAQDALPNGLFFSADGLKLYVVGSSYDRVYQYNLGIPFSLTLPVSIENPPTETFGVGDQASYTFVTLDGGTTVKLINEEVL